MAHRRTDARVVARLQRADPPLDRRAHRLAEVLHRLDAHPGPPARGEGEDAVVIAAGRQSVGQHEQGLFLDVEHAVSVDPSVRRERNVDQQRDREVVPLRAHRDVDPIEPAAAGAQIAARADQRIEVEVVPVRLGAQDLAAGPQRLELPSHLADLAAHGSRPAPRSRLVSDAVASPARGNDRADRRRCGSPIPDRAGRPSSRAASTASGGRSRSNFSLVAGLPVRLPDREFLEIVGRLPASSSSLSSEGRSTLTISAMARIFSKRLSTKGSRALGVVLALAHREALARVRRRGLGAARALVVALARGGRARASSNRPTADMAGRADIRQAPRRAAASRRSSRPRGACGRRRRHPAGRARSAPPPVRCAAVGGRGRGTAVAAESAV